MSGGEWAVLSGCAQPAQESPGAHLGGTGDTGVPWPCAVGRQQIDSCASHLLQKSSAGGVAFLCPSCAASAGSKTGPFRLVLYRCHPPVTCQKVMQTAIDQDPY